MLKNAYLLAKIGADTAENEQHFAEMLLVARLASFRAPLVGFVWSVTFVQLSCAKWGGCLLLLSLDKPKSKHTAAEGFLNGS